MKKYLVTGLAAVAISGMFTSCTHDTDGGNGNTNLGVVETYEQAFISRFGTPSADADWGFGPSTSQASTRSGNMEGKTPVAQTSTGINANANEWADKADAPHGHGGWLVPPALTEPQKEVVRKYFQANPKLEYKDPHFANFFVQQVYKGGTNKPETGNKETNKGANGTSYSSDNMNLLTVGYNEQHINNFNRGTYNAETVATDSYGNPLPGTKADDGMVNVLDNGYTVNDFADHHHPDQIMLMVNIDDTGCMGYHNSGCSKQRNDKAALVGWETIRDWANQNGLNGNCLDDKWNRSFVGFDFALYNLDESYLKEGGKVVNAKFSDGQLNGLQYVWDGTKIMKRGKNGVRTRSKIGTRGGVQVYNGGDIYIAPGINYADGDYIYMYNGNEIVGKLIFHGEGSASVKSSALPNFKAVVERPYFTFKSLINSNGGNGGQLQVFNNKKGKLIVYDETDQKVLDTQWYNTNGYTTGVVGGHTYRLYCEEKNVDLDLYGISYYQQGITIDDNSADSPGTNQTNNKGTEEQQEQEEEQEEQGQEEQVEESEVLYDSDYLIVDGKEIPMLISNKNMYGGVRYLDGDEKLTDTDMKITKNGKECFNLEKIKEMVDNGYLPVQNSNLRTWVKWEFGDGYFSDWIVTLTEAKRNDEDTSTDVPTLRVIAEDLGDQSLNENSDFDFNDVVFDVTWKSENEVEIEILAAGGTLPLTVGWDGTTGNYRDYEVHNLLGYSETMIINTNSNVGSHIENVPSVKRTLNGTFSKTNFAANVRDNIPVKVRKNGVWYDIEADKGKVAGKLAVAKDYDWCDERVDVDDWWMDNDKKGLFIKYTQAPATLTKYWYRQAKYRRLQNKEIIEVQY